MQDAGIKSNEVSGIVDWLTVTSKTREGGFALQSLFLKHKTGRVTQTKLFGFECTRDTANLTYGIRAKDARHIFIAAGEAARKTWRAAVPVASKVTRLDLACDVWLKDPRDQVKESSRLVLSPAYEGQCNYTMVTGMKGNSKGRKGDTLYVGSRQSAQFGRFYDKGLQQGSAPQGKWLRYEIEYKDKAAGQVAKAACVLNPGQLGEFIKVGVYDWFLKRAIVPAFLPETDTPGFQVRAEMKQTTAEKKLAWLNSQVRPTVEYLVEMGFRDQVVNSLGLELVYPRENEYDVISM